MRCLLLSLFSLFLIQANAQSFEGIIKYKMTLNNPNSEVRSDTDFYESLGKDAVRYVKFYIKGDRYKSYNKTTKSIELYDPESNQIYYYKAKMDSAMVVNALVKHERITDYSVVEAGEMVDDIKCSTLVIEAFKAINKYHYNTNHYPVDKNLFSRHLYGHLAEYFEESGAIPLKIEMHNFIRNVTWEAVKIKEKKVADRHFTIPDFKKLFAAEFVYGTYNLYDGY